jgi:hypothetical protein
MEVLKCGKDKVKEKTSPTRMLGSETFTYEDCNYKMRESIINHIQNILHQRCQHERKWKINVFGSYMPPSIVQHPENGHRSKGDVTYKM